MMANADPRRRFDPQMIQVQAESQRLNAGRTPPAADDIAAQRAAYAHERAFWNAVRPPLAAVEALSIPGPVGPLACRLYRPDLAPNLPALVYFHGGGFVVGDLDTHDGLCRLFAHEGGFRVIAVDYRLAPEHKWPAPLDDAMAAVDWIDRKSVV